MVIVDAVQLTDLAAGQVLILGQCRAHRVSLSATYQTGSEARSGPRVVLVSVL